MFAKAVMSKEVKIVIGVETLNDTIRRRFKENLRCFIIILTFNAIIYI